MVKVFWFRKDLRLEDNRALYHFIESIGPDDKFLLLYIKNKNTFEYFGEKRIAFLYESLENLEKELKLKDFNLYIYKGNSTDCFKFILQQFKAILVYANSQIEPYSIERDKKVKAILKNNNSDLLLFSDTTLFEPGEVIKDDKTPYTVYTPFNKKCFTLLNNSHFAEAEIEISKLDRKNNVCPGNSFNFKEEYSKIQKSTLIEGGRNEGLKLLSDFINNNVKDYNVNRDFPGFSGTSLLSPHLHFGTISIREAYRNSMNKHERTLNKSGINTWINELLWREFYYQITYHFPHVMKKSFREKFDELKWSSTPQNFIAWKEGMTGYPLVDAGMRQLKEEGWMHNRVRMITAMFLTKDLFIDWRKGEKHFAENLIDMDFSSNNGGWQWSASTGCDAQPYFRVFNPYLQSRKYDANGDYIRKYVKELANIPAKYIHNPVDMTDNEQAEYNVVIGKDYPKPIVEHQTAKEFAVLNFKKLK